VSKKISYYVAVFIDILGQGDKLAKITDLPDTKEEEVELFKLFRETAGAVKGLHKTFEGFFESYRETSEEVKRGMASWTPEMIVQFEKSKELDLKYLKFSDTVVLYFPLDKEVNVAPLRSVYAALSATASSFLIMLSQEIPLRGAINIGIATELEDSGIYGPILQNLHYLESQVADYPRIVIGKELIQMIDHYEKEEISNPSMYQTMDKALIPSIKELIKIDSDGLRVVNYLDKSIADSLIDKKIKIYKDIESYAEEEFQNFKGNDKLRDRYKKLKSYIRKNKSNWL